MCEEEDDEANCHAYRGVCEDFGAFAGRCLGTWAVWAERNPVCCVCLVSKPLRNQSTPAVLCIITTSIEVLSVACSAGVSPALLSIASPTQH
jgi:hypothetical protein